MFIIRTEYRDELINYLKANGIETLVHYPVLIHLQKAYKGLGYTVVGFPVAEAISKTILSLPL